MIRIDQELTIEGATVYRDEVQRNRFYILPNQPRFRLDDSGKPVFKFIKYRIPIDKPDGGKGGGFLIFDAEFVVPDDKLKKVRSALDDLVSQERGQGPAQLGDFTFTRGNSTLLLLDNGGALVEKISSAGKPSLYGHNVSAFNAQVSPTGAAVLEAAMQGAGGVAQVIYDLYFVTKIPPIGGHVWFFAEKFYSFYQQIDKSDDHWWNGNSGELRDTRREQFRNSDSGGVDFNFDWVLPDPDQDAKLKNKIRDWGWGALEDAVKRLTLSDPTANTDSGLPDGVHHVTRDFSTDKTASFDRYFRESDAVEWHVLPQGTLPNITGMPGVKWPDYSAVIDADDPFHRTLRVNAGVNADFKAFGIQSIDLWVQYGGQILKTFDANGVELAPHFTNGDQRFAFSAYVANNSWKYTYGFKVNYVGLSLAFDSGPIESEANVLTVDVGDLGLLALDVFAGSIDWSQVASAEVTLSYEDAGSGVARVEKRSILTKAADSDRWLALIVARRARPFSYSVKYTMSDGQEYTATNLQVDSPQLYVDDPFYTKAVHLRSLLDFVKDVDTIFVDLTYTDAANKVSRSQSIALTKAMSFFDWTFPAITGSAGQVTYSGRIKYQDTTEAPIPQTIATSDTIYLEDGGVAFLDVTILPDLVNWSQVKLVTVSLQYADPANGIAESKSVPVKAGVSPGTWRVKLKDKTKRSFTWSATYYLGDAASTHRTSPPVTTDDTNVVLQLPPA
jgi:hypothetical protein